MRNLLLLLAWAIRSEVCKDGCVSLWVVKLENIYFGCSNLHSSPPSAYSIFLCAENFIRKESDLFVHRKLEGIMWSFHTMAKDSNQKCMHVMCRKVRFLSQWKLCDTNSLRRGKVPVSSWFQRSQSVATPSCCLWAWCKNTP